MQPMKKSNEQTLKEAIQELLDAYKLKEGIQESQLIHSWDRIAGQYVAKNPESLSIRNKTLYVRLNSPALKNELSFARSSLVESLNKAVGQEVITGIVFL